MRSAEPVDARRLAIQRAAGQAMEPGDIVSCYGWTSPVSRTRHTITAKRAGVSQTGIQLQVTPALRGIGAHAWLDSAWFIRE